MHRIDGKEIAERILFSLRDDIEKIKPNVSVLYAGNDPSTLSYIKSKVKTADRHNVKVNLVNFDYEALESEFIERIKDLSCDNSCGGIIVEKPLPPQISIKRVSEAIGVFKDIDCMNPSNLGKLISDDFLIAPSTASAVINILNHSKIEFKSKRVVIIGRSEIVGKPLSMLFLAKSRGDATVTVVHSKSNDIESITREADIIVAALGRPCFLKKNFISDRKPVLIDVGINYHNNRIVGDIDEECYSLASSYTPVPGGVGPVTVASLFENLVILKKNYG